MKNTQHVTFEVLAVGIISFIGIVVETAMNIAFPDLMREFHVGTSTIQWLTTGYLLVLSLVIPTSAYLNKRFSARHLFFAAVLSALIGTGLCALAHSYVLLLVGRIIQGIGTGIAMPLMYNIILTQTPREKLGVMMGIATLITVIAPAIGPSLGGLIINFLGWRFIFVVLLPFLLIALIVGTTTIADNQVHTVPHFDGLGYLLLIISFVSLISATSIAGQSGWLSVNVVLLLLLFLIGIGFFAFHERHQQDPLIQTTVFSSKPFSLSVLVIILIQFNVLGLSYLIPNYAQLVHQASPLIAGCLLLPGCVVGALMAPISGRLYDRFGAKRPIMLGVLVLCIALVSFYLLPKQNSIILFIYVLFAFGQGLCVSNVMTNGLAKLPTNQNADGNAIFTTLQQLAGAIGTSVVTTIVSSSQASGAALASTTATGSLRAYFLLAILGFVLVISAFGIFQPPR